MFFGRKIFAARTHAEMQKKTKIGFSVFLGGRATALINRIFEVVEAEMVEEEQSLIGFLGL